MLFLRSAPLERTTAGRPCFVLLVYTRRSGAEGCTMRRLSEALGMGMAELVGRKAGR